MVLRLPPPLLVTPITVVISLCDYSVIDYLHVKTIVNEVRDAVLFTAVAPASNTVSAHSRCSIHAYGMIEESLDNQRKEVVLFSFFTDKQPTAQRG